MDVDLSWYGGDPDDDTVTYDIYFGNTTDMMIVSCNQTDTIFDPGILELETSYCWKVVATDNNGASATSPLWSFLTESGPVPDSPTGLIAEVVSDSQIDLQWADNSSNELGFKIERKIEVADIYIQICTVGYNVTSFSDTGLAEGTDYYYRVCAYSSSGNSSYSNEASVTTWIRPISSFEISSQGLMIGQVDHTIIFDASSSFDLDGTIDYWQWEFGDGNTTTGEIVEHIYSSAGNYTIDLTVVDNQGLADVSSRNITVAKAGDVNEDGVVDTYDVMGEERCILGLDYPGPGADADQDCEINPTDITAIELIIAPSLPSGGSADNAVLSIEAPDQVTQGDSLVARVEIDNINDFDACAFDLTFDNSILWVTEVTAGNISGSTIPVDMWAEITAGTIRVVQNIPGTTGASGSSYLAEIHFLALNVSAEEETSPLDISNVIISDTSGSPTPIILVDGSVTVTQPIPEFMEGDVTLDNYVRASDAMFILQYLVGTRTLNEDQLKCADTTDDGQVSAVDAMHILQWLVDPDCSLGVLYKPLWQSPTDDDLLEPDAG